ncbi:MAG: hypothetical protein AB7L13_09470 [Acidimicrobiia bacterium]
MDIIAIIKLLRRNWVVVAVVVAATTFFAVLLSSQKAKTFNASAQVLLTPNDPNEQLADANSFSAIDFNRHVANEAARAESLGVATRTAQALGISADEVQSAIKVTHGTNSDVLTIEATTSDPDVAVKIANATAQAYLDSVKDEQVADTKAKLDQLDKQIQALTDDAAKRQKTVSDAQGVLPKNSSGVPDGPLPAAAQQEKNTLDLDLGLLKDLTGRRSQLAADEALKKGSGTLIETADKADPSAGLGTAPAAVGGAFIGLLLALVLSLVLEESAQRVQTGVNLGELGIDNQVIGELPSERELANDSPGAPAMLSRPTSKYTEAVRTLRTSLALTRNNRADFAVLVTSPSRSEGKSLLATSLAIAFAQSGAKTVLVSADLRNPAIEDLLGLPFNASGLSDFVLDGGSEVADLPLLTLPDVPELLVLTAGTDIQSPAEVISSPNTMKVVRKLVGSGHMVVIDSPPVLEYSDALLLATYADSTLLTVSVGRTRRSSLQRAVTTLTGRAFPPLNLVFNQARDE